MIISLNNWFFALAEVCKTVADFWQLILPLACKWLKRKWRNETKGGKNRSALATWSHNTITAFYCHCCWRVHHRYTIESRISKSRVSNTNFDPSHRSTERTDSHSSDSGYSSKSFVFSFFHFRLQFDFERAVFDGEFSFSACLSLCVREEQSKLTSVYEFHFKVFILF